MILAGSLLFAEPAVVSGLLFIGDPHLSSSRPGRRKDADWADTVMGKLDFIVKTANERNLYPVFLGDLSDEPVDPVQSLRTRLLRTLKSFWTVPLSNTGNHDMTHSVLSDDDSLSYLALSDAIDVVKVSGPVGTFSIGGKLIGLGMTPYGQEIPHDVRGMFPGANLVIWVTHHDMAFEGAYPDATKPFAIEGCGLVINGHIHLKKKEIKVGGTTWFNPGNITRLSVDCMDHVPTIYALGATGKMEAIKIPHQSDVFDLTGKLVDAASSEDVVADTNSAFVDLLKAEGSAEMERSADGSVVSEEIDAKFQADSTPADVVAIVRSLLTDAVQRRKATA